jgi:hypothetical protein
MATPQGVYLCLVLLVAALSLVHCCTQPWPMEPCPAYDYSSSNRSHYVLPTFRRRHLQPAAPPVCTAETSIYLAKHKSHWDTLACSQAPVIVSTVVLGAQDMLPSVLVAVAPNWTCYSAFLDEASLRANNCSGGATCRGWNVYPVSYLIHKDPRQASRLFKILLPFVFPASLWSIYIDSKYQLMVDPVSVMHQSLWSKGAIMTMAFHSYRFSWLEEQDAVLAKGLVAEHDIARQREDYIQQGMPTDYTGLVDGCFILRKHTATTLQLSCAWWHQYVKYPPRDQTSVNFVFHQAGFHPTIHHQQFLAAKERPDVAVAMQYYYTNNASNERIHVMSRCLFDDRYCYGPRPFITIAKYVGHVRQDGIS